MCGTPSPDFPRVGSHFSECASKLELLSILIAVLHFLAFTDASGTCRSAASCRVCVWTRISRLGPKIRLPFDICSDVMKIIFVASSRKYSRLVFPVCKAAAPSGIPGMCSFVLCGFSKVPFLDPTLEPEKRRRRGNEAERLRVTPGAEVVLPRARLIVWKLICSCRPERSHAPVLLPTSSDGNDVSQSTALVQNRPVPLYL